MLRSDQRFSLDKKNILITGGAGLLGRVFVNAFIEHGANVIIVDRDQAIIDEFITTIKTSHEGQKIYGYQCDITSEPEIVEMLNSVYRDVGLIHVLHNNAASKSSNLNLFFEPFENYSLDIWNEVMSVNINGMFLMAKHVGRHMIEHQIQGSIIQTSSIYGSMAPDQRIYEGSQYLGRPINTPAVYTASKSAVVGLTKYLAAYWGQKGIRVNTLTPGGIESGQNAIFTEKYSQRIPMNRMGKADELVGALIFLASDASSYVTGQNLMIDGGLSAW